MLTFTAIIVIGSLQEQLGFVPTSLFAQARFQISLRALALPSGLGGYLQAASTSQCLLGFHAYTRNDDTAGLLGLGTLHGPLAVVGCCSEDTRMRNRENIKRKSEAGMKMGL